MANLSDEYCSCPFIRVQVERAWHLGGKPSGISDLSTQFPWVSGT